MYQVWNFAVHSLIDPEDMNTQFYLSRQSVMLIRLVAHPYARSVPRAEAIVGALHARLTAASASDEEPPALSPDAIKREILDVSADYGIQSDKGFMFTIALKQGRDWHISSVGTHCALHIANGRATRLIRPHSVKEAAIDRGFFNENTTITSLRRDLADSGITHVANGNFSADTIRTATVTLEHQEWLFISMNPAVQYLDLPQRPTTLEHIHNGMDELARDYAYFERTYVAITPQSAN